MRALGAGGLVQHDIGRRVVFPRHALHREPQTLGIEVSGAVVAGPAIHGDEALLHQASADAPRTEALAIEDILQLHGASAEHQRQQGRIVEHMLHDEAAETAGPQFKNGGHLGPAHIPAYLFMPAALRLTGLATIRR